MKVQNAMLACALLVLGVVVGWSIRPTQTSAAVAATSPAVTGHFQNYANTAIAALKKAGVAGGCPMCQQNDWVVHEFPVSIPIYGADGKINFPDGETMPAAAMICKKCGYISFHSLGALDLLNSRKKDPNK